MTRYAAILIAATTAPALALDSFQSDAGAVQIRTTACMLAKSSGKPPCRLPELGDGSDNLKIAAARLDRARYFIDLGDLKDAFAEANEALNASPGDIDIHHLVARLALSIGDADRAEQEIKIALQQRPNDANLQATDASRLISARPREAVRLFDRVLREHPDHRFSRESRAKLELALGFPAETIADVDVLLADMPKDRILLSLRADANLARGNSKEAVADLSKALEESPGDFGLLSQRAMANTLVGDDDATLADFNTLLGPIGGTPNYAIGGEQLSKYRMQRALILVRMKRFSEAATDAISALNVGGRRSLLRAQIFLRNSGFPQIPLDGQTSEALSQAMKACMGLNSCFEKVSSSL
jgi:tetratricopeptide (TPR) repeat protein